MIVTPLIITLAITIVNYYVSSMLGEPPLAIKEYQENKTKYISVGIEAYTYENMIQYEEQLSAVYNIVAGSIDTWGNGIDYDTYTEYKDDFIYVNGDICQTEDFGDYLVYTYDNEKSLKVSKDKVDTLDTKEFKHQVPEDLEPYSEEYNEDETIKTCSYSDGTKAVYNCTYSVDDSNNDQIVIEISIFYILITYFILLLCTIVFVTFRNKMCNK